MAFPQNLQEIFGMTGASSPVGSGLPALPQGIMQANPMGGINPSAKYDMQPIGGSNYAGGNYDMSQGQTLNDIMMDAGLQPQYQQQYPMPQVKNTQSNNTQGILNTINKIGEIQNPQLQGQTQQNGFNLQGMLPKISEGLGMINKRFAERQPNNFVQLPNGVILNLPESTGQTLNKGMSDIEQGSIQSGKLEDIYKQTQPQGQQQGYNKGFMTPEILQMQQEADKQQAYNNYYNAKAQAESQVNNELKGEFGANIRYMLDNGLMTPEQAGAQISQRIETLAKNPNTLYSQSQATALGKGQGTLPTAYQIEQQKMAGREGYAQPSYNQQGYQPQGQPQGYNPIQGQSLTSPQELTPIKGSKAFREEEQAAKKGLVRSERITRMGKNMGEDVDRALKVIEDKGQLAAGFGGLISGVPSTPAKELQGHLDAIKGQIGIDTLLQIKAEGSGLGQVPQAQLNMLAGVLGNLDQTQSPEVLKYNLNRVKNIYNQLIQEHGDEIARVQGNIDTLRGGAKQPEPQEQSDFETLWGES